MAKIPLVRYVPKTVWAVLSSSLTIFYFLILFWVIPTFSRVETMILNNSTAVEWGDLRKGHKSFVCDGWLIFTETCVFPCFKKAEVMHRQGSCSSNSWARDRKIWKILRFLLDVTDSISKRLQTCIAVPRPNTYNYYLFYSSSPPIFRLILKMSKREVGGVNFGPLLSITLHQRCPNWFILRQYIITGTDSGAVLHSNIKSRYLTGIPGEACDSTVIEWMEIFTTSCFIKNGAQRPLFGGW